MYKKVKEKDSFKSYDPPCGREQEEIFFFTHSLSHSCHWVAAKGENQTENGRNTDRDGREMRKINK